MTTATSNERAELDLPRLAQQALSIYAANPLSLILIAVVGLPLRLAFVDIGIWLYFWTLTSIILEGLVFAALTHATATAWTGSAPNPVTSYRVVLSKLLTLVELLVRELGAFLLLLVTLVGIPFALRLLVRWFFGLHGVVLNDLSAKDAISHSCRLATGRFWRLAGTMLLVFALAYVASGSAAWIIWGWQSTLESTVLSGSLATLLQPLLAAFWALLFLRLQPAAGGPAPALSTVH